MSVKKFNEFNEENAKKPISDKLRKNKNALFSKKIRIFSADKQFVISNLFYFWTEFPNKKVFNNEDQYVGEYNIYTDNKKNKMLVVSEEKIIEYISPELLDFVTAQDINDLDPDTFAKWKNVVE